MLEIIRMPCMQPGLNRWLSLCSLLRSFIVCSGEYMDYRDVRVTAFDGLLLPGGGDINPDEYGERNQGSVPVEKWVDELQFGMLEDFLGYGKPVFGICWGCR